MSTARAEPGTRTTSARSRLVTARDVGRVNRSRVLQTLADHGPLSRAELARHSNVPRGTIGTIVKDLLETGWLVEGPPRRPGDATGKPATPLWFGDRAGLCGAIHVRPGVVSTAVVSAGGTILASNTAALPRREGTKALDRVLLRAAKATFAGYESELTGIGVALPAAVDMHTGRVFASTPLPDLAGTTIAAQLVRNYGVPVTVEEDVTALAHGQRWFGQARGIEDFVALQIGEGIGASVMLGGHLLRTQVGLSEVGHTCVDLHGQQCPCGLRGCWETLASNRWLRANARERSLPSAPRLTVATLVKRAQRGDPASIALADEYAANVAIGIANLVQLLAVPLFILHGDVSDGGEYLRSRIATEVASRTMQLPSGAAPTTTIVLTNDDRQAALLGAAAAMLSKTLSFHV